MEKEDKRPPFRYYTEVFLLAWTSLMSGTAHKKKAG